jgi:hypothetical protein
MIFIITVFAPAFFAMTISEYLWRWFFPRRRRRRCKFPKHYYLRMRVNRQVSWTRKLNMAFLRRFIASLHQHQIWIYKRHGWKYQFVIRNNNKKCPALDFLDEPTVDAPAQVLRNKVLIPQ